MTVKIDRDYAERIAEPLTTPFPSAPPPDYATLRARVREHTALWYPAAAAELAATPEMEDVLGPIIATCDNVTLCADCPARGAACEACRDDDNDRFALAHPGALM